jgi:hypothetical protein
MFRSPTYLEVAFIIAIGGSVLAVAVPTFLHELQASRLTEAVDGVRKIATGAVVYADGKPLPMAFPPPAPLTPASIPRGDRVVDPDGTWDHLTWASLGFSINHAHYFSFAFDSTNGPAQSSFVARAHGDLDGDGERSTFEMRGEATVQGAQVLPGLLVDREVE